MAGGSIPYNNKTLREVGPKANFKFKFWFEFQLEGQKSLNGPFDCYLCNMFLGISYFTILFCFFTLVSQNKFNSINKKILINDTSFVSGLNTKLCAVYK